MTNSNNGSTRSRLIIVSNRLPIIVSKDSEGKPTIAGASGGLVTALAPVLSNRGGVWIGWPGVAVEEISDLDNVLATQTGDLGYKLSAVNLTADEKEKHYEGFSNEIIWPLFHDFAAHCKFNPDYWATYCRINARFAEEIVKNSKAGDFIWVHDYQLMLVATELRKQKIDSQIAFFLHIPFPPLDIFVKLPWRFQVLNALLEYDLIGFQTLRDRRNFLQCVRTLIPGTRVTGRGQVVNVDFGQRKIRVGAFPVSIDFNDFAESAAAQETSERAWYIHEDLPNQQIILGIDRLDYSKGIPERLKAFRNALMRFPELHNRVTLVQVVVPSRRSIPKYASLKTEIERLVGSINGQFTQSGWVPLHYIFRSLDRHELLAYYRTAEIALVTPLKDGMNLVAKEYCACNLEQNGVLILSEFAGVAAEFQDHTILVNPHDIEGIAEAIVKAFNMDTEERRRRMVKLRGTVRKHNIFWWVDSFLQAAFARDLSAFPLLEDYVPQK